ncbi:LacI family DNA-binding transcriptional regulator [Streptomyces palmae]|uniref:LacI family transcriptional regulator n=1 Tax=Streptomyces palmae TaxID=1701085 RepID=A0A4Z0H703_9ACTN|nr:LacI family DNA-binding transcriptional regulator [Streptomyces palmae]TGB09002.1 LacI family transcriptional regulator [Streptomyces palmae]
MATMADVARRAGVSVATVSHVLNKTRPVRPGTRRSVLAAIEELGYTRNTLARSLVTACTRSIGLAISASAHPVFAELLQGAERCALEHGYSLMIADPRDDPAHERTVVGLLHERRVDGVLVAPSAKPAALLDYLSRSRIPAVLLDRAVGDGHDRVRADGSAAVADLVGHLAELGHVRIGLIAGPAAVSGTAERVVGYRTGLRRQGLAYAPELLAQGHCAAEGAASAVHRLLESPRPPTALVTADRTMTVGALRGLREAGCRVPEDVALVCFDDFPWADVFSPRLTAVARPGQEIGARAVRLLLDRLAHPDRPARDIRLPCAFVHRASCGCLP